MRQVLLIDYTVCRWIRPQRVRPSINDLVSAWLGSSLTHLSAASLDTALLILQAGSGYREEAGPLWLDCQHSH